jgi:hypothetical protein
MARLNTNAELFAKLTLFGVMQDSTSGLSAVISTGAGPAAGGSTFGVSATATGSTGVYIRIGPAGGAEIGQVEAGTSLAVTLKSQVLEAHSSGEAVVQQLRTDLGDIQDDGVQSDIQADRNRIDVATKRHRYAWHIQHTDYVMTVGLENWSAENLLASMAIPESNIHGAGSAADPTVVDWDPELIDTISPLHFYAQGAFKDGRTLEVQWWDVNIDPAKSFNMARGQDAPLTLAFTARMQRFLFPIS